jgi:iron complex outermembrane receptor protein
MVTDQDGRFRSGALRWGTYEIVVARLGYETSRRTLQIASTDEAANSNLQFALEPQAIPTPQIEVSTTKVSDRGSAVAFTELDRTAIKERYWAQDVPMLLAETPGVYAYSDAGNVGYSYVKVRGFAQRRVAVTVNGIPLNDPESHEVYWVDHPDLVTSSQSLQVQRGVGSALYGSSAVGGSINLETLSTPGDRSISLEAGVGTFDTQRYAVQYNSGLLDDRYSMTGRLSRISSDGYREQSWTSLWSYYLSTARYDSWLTTHLNFYGGPERLHLAYYAVDRSYLDGQITGDAGKDRRFNPLTWSGETDNFFEPHFELIQDVKLTEKAALTSSIFYFPGKGFYDDFPYGPQTFASRQLPDFTVPSNTQYPAFTTRHDRRGAVHGRRVRHDPASLGEKRALWLGSAG